MTDLEDGQLAFDVAKQSLVEVVDDDVGTVGEQDPAMVDLITKAEGNKAVGFDADTRCVEVEYVGIDSGDRSYTMPATRIRVSSALIEALSVIAQTAGVAEDIHPGLKRDETLDEYDE